MSRARKLVILEGAVMPEYESTVAEAMHRLADVGETLAGVLASIAAGAHSKDSPGQREMASVIMADAITRFAELDNRLDPKRQEALNAYIDGICRGKKR